MRAFVSALLAVAALAQQDNPALDVRQKPGGLYDYREGGYDWNQLRASDLKGALNECESSMHRVQSPINLFTKDTGMNGKKTLYKDQDMSVIVPKMGSDKQAKIDLTEANFPVNLYHPFGDWKDKDIVYKRVDASAETLTFAPLQIHWHAPSEHTVDGKYYDAEAHIVHLNEETGGLAVLGIFFEVPAFTMDKTVAENEEVGKNDWVQSYLTAFDTRNNEDEDKKTAIDMSDLIKNLKSNLDNAKEEDKSFFMYSGSLTTPPCTEGVAWTVMKSPLSISSGQLKEIATYTKGEFKVPDDDSEP